MYYNVDDIKTNMKKDLAKAKAFCAAWQAVTFPTKKDGKPFSNMSKNISGAKYTMEQYAMQDGEYELTVYTHTTSSGYIYDSIRAFNLVRDLKDENMIAKTENYMPKQTYLEQVYKYDLDDIKKAVADRAAYWKEYAEDLEKQIAGLDRVFQNFRTAYAEAMKTLEEDTAHYTHKDSFYAVRDCVKARYPYC